MTTKNERIAQLCIANPGLLAAVLSHALHIADVLDKDEAWAVASCLDWEAHKGRMPNVVTLNTIKD